MGTSVGDPPSSRHNLPADLATFVGRAREVAEVTQLVQRSRLVTITGVGGAGKTRLALRVAADLLPRFPDGVWVVELAPLTDSSLVPYVVASAVGIHTASATVLESMVVALRSRRTLLVLDNCEHLIAACARVAETLLGACHGLRILATSREPLRVSGEIAWRVPPLSLPGDPVPPPELLAGCEAVELFLDRVRGRRPGFELTVDNAASVAAICRELNGLPLAIELAAAQTGTLAPQEVAARLSDALRLLSGGSRTVPRQETLRAALDWSRDLLDEAEKVLFRRLAVFAGGFDLAAAEGVCAGEGLTTGDILTLLTRLVEKSLIEPHTVPGATRFGLLEPVRQYAREDLMASGELQELQCRHAHYFARLAERIEPNLMSRERRSGMERLAAEQDNLRAALEWSRYAETPAAFDVGLRLVGALFWFWNLRGDVSEGYEWAETLLIRGTEADPAARGWALYAAAEMGWLLGKTSPARERAEEAVALFRGLGDRRRLAYALQSLPMAIDNPQGEEAVAESMRLFEEVGDAWGAALAVAAPDLFALMGKGDPTGQGRARLEAALARWRELGDDWGTAQTLNMLGDVARSRGEEPEATVYYEEALTLLRRQGTTGTVPSLLHNLGYLALRRGDTRRALRLFRESLTLFRDQGDQRGIADCLTGLGCALTLMGLLEEAGRVFGAAEATREMTGATIWPANVADYENSVFLLRGRLPESSLGRAWSQGRRLGMDQAITEALSHERVPVGDMPELTAREREVVGLVAEGLTNRQIGARLFITEGTARLHVKHILQKLGFSSRAQIAAWAVEQRMSGAHDEMRERPERRGST